jgi:hypothetical protein
MWQCLYFSESLKMKTVLAELVGCTLNQTVWIYVIP